MSKKRGARMTTIPPGWHLVGDRMMRITDNCQGAVEPEPIPAPAPKGRGQWAPYRSKLEWRFAQELVDWGAGPGRRITYEALRLPLASVGGKPSYYMPDFQAWRQIELVSIYEVKGGHRWRRGGIDRLRAAAAAYPEWEWLLVERENGAWKIQRVEG